MVDTCVCCGAYVHEGRQVCSNCESEANKGFVKTDNPSDYNAMEPKRSLIAKILSKFIKRGSAL